MWTTITTTKNWNDRYYFRFSFYQPILPELRDVKRELVELLEPNFSSNQRRRNTEAKPKLCNYLILWIMSDVQRKVVVVVAVFHIREGLSLPVEAFDLVVNKSSPSVNSTFAGVRRRYRTTYVTNCTIPLRTTLKVYNFFKGVGQFLRLQGGQYLRDDRIISYAVQDICLGLQITCSSIEDYAQSI